MKITIIGLGYVGLPLAVQTALKGFNVAGVDKNIKLLESLKKGKSLLEDSFTNNNIEKVNIDYSEKLTASDVYIVCVPTPVKNGDEPDLSYVKKAVEEITDVLEDNQLIVIESTINPGVCEESVDPLLNRSGKKYLLAHCPERINPGDKKWNVSNIPRVVGGIDKESTDAAFDVYSKIIDASVTKVSQIRAAEATKILENTFRDINIAFVNEMAQSFYKLGIDISEVIKGASTKPFGFLPHFPGVGVGGHCIAVDPYYMIKKGKDVGFNHDFLSLARRINKSMPDFTVKIIQDELDKLGIALSRAKITVLGVAYKPHVSDDRESPSYKVIESLNEKNDSVKIYDPYVEEYNTFNNTADAVISADCVVITTAHKEFIDPELYRDVKIVVDGRNCLPVNNNEEYPFVYKGIGINS